LCHIWGARERCIQDLGGETKGRNPLRRLRRRWKGNIKMDPKEIGWEDLNWIVLPQDRDKRQTVVNAVMNLRVL
jgi:hypothetical protein